MRKLSSIRRIAEIREIENADSIESVRIDGWWVITKKNEFKVDDLCIYFEIDSFLPICPEFEFLRKSCFKTTKHLGDGFRIKTIKLRGQISQGLVLHIKSFFDDSISFTEGDDVTEFINVKKWEVPISENLAGIVKGNFPSFIRKTDQERIQNCYGDLQQYHKNDLFEATIKLDGSSMTVYLNNDVFGVCSRNIELKETEDNTFWKVARKYKMEEMLRSYGKNIAIQGELMGPGIQKNREFLKDHEFYLFDVWDIDNHKYYLPLERIYFILDCNDNGFNISSIPNLGSVSILNESLDDILKKSEIKSINNKIAEGIVYRSLENKTSFKVINNKFLLGEK